MDIAAGQGLPGAASAAFGAVGLHRALLESMSEGVSLSSEDGVIVYTNPAEDALFGYGPGELIGQPVSVQNAYPPEQNARIVGEVIAALRAHGHWEGEWWNRRKDGSTFTSSSRITAVSIDGAAYWLCVQRDVTDRRSAEQRHAFLLALSDRLREGEPEDALQQVCQIMGEYFACSRVGYGHLDAEADVFDYRVCWTDGLAPPLLGRLPAHVFGVKIVAKLSRGGTVVVDDLFDSPLSDEATTLRTAGEVDTRAILVVPFLWGGQLRSIIYLNNRAPRAWTADETALVEEVAERTRRVIELTDAARARRAAEDRLRFLDTLAQTTGRLSEADAVLSATTRLVGEHLGLSVCAYADMEADEDHFTIRGDWAAPGCRSIVGRYSLADFGQLAVERLGAGAPLVINDNLKEIAPEEAATFQAIGISATICMPLVKDGRLTALMAIHDKSPRHWTEAELGLSKEVTERSWAHVERVAAEAELRQLNATLEHRIGEAVTARKVFADVVEATDALVQVVDTDFRWIAANQASRDEYRRVYAVEPSPGASMLETLAGLPQAAPTLARWRRALAGESFTEVHRVHRVVGDSRFYELKFAPLRDADGRQIAAFQFVHDITERVEEQQRLRDAEEQLRQAQKMESVGQLTGGVAHDFNNLLTPIIGSLDMLQRKGLGGERERRLIAGAMQSADRARTLVQRLLAFARRQPLQPTAVDVAALVRGMADLVSSTTGPQIRVSVDLADDLAPAHADANQLEMALLNLSVNARDAMPSGGDLRISAANADVAVGERQDLASGRYVRLSVADTGVGMDTATLARAIEPFFSTKGVGKGTGLGLSMVHGLVQQLGGALSLQSREGLGTNVELWLPLSDRAAEAPSASAPGQATVAGRGIALLVDDEALVRMSTSEMLTDLGFEVREAGSAEEALALLGAGLRPAVVVTDHLMPGMDGADLARAVQNRWPGTPVLIVSGYAELESIDQDLPRLSKPFRNEELAAALAQFG